MRKVIPVILSLIVLYTAIGACDKSDSGRPTGPSSPADTSDEETPPPDAPPSAGSAPYSGRWSGTVTITDVNPNFCVYPDKLVEVAQSWTVQGDSVQVAEIVVINSERKTYYWRGTIRNDTLEMLSKRYERCAGENRLRQLKLKAPIKAAANTYGLEAYTVYDVCEPHCTFEWAYQLRKE